jgi:putative MFS transporter
MEISQQPASEKPSIAQRLDGLHFNRLHLLLFAMLGAGLLFDQMESTLSGVLTAVFSEPSAQVSRSGLTWMLFAYYAVAAVGAPLMGLVSDRIGRRAALIITFAGFGILTIIATLMPDFGSFATFRVASSFALSAAPPLIFAYLADILPPNRRGSLMMLASMMAALGAAIAPLITRWGNLAQPFGLAGWQVAMLLGGIAGVLLCLCMFKAPESPRWLASSGRTAETESQMSRFEASKPLRKVGIAARDARTRTIAGVALPDLEGSLFSRNYIGRLSMIMLLLFLQAFGLTAFAVLLTKALIMKGMVMQDALAQTSLVLMAMPIGVLALTPFTDRFARRAMFIWVSVTLGICAIVFGFAQQRTVLAAAGLGFCFLMTAHMTIGQIYCAEIFPTRLRGTAMGLGYGAMRVGSAGVPVVMLPLLLDYGPAVMFSAIGGLMLLAAVLARLLGPEIKPQSALR